MSAELFTTQNQESPILVQNLTKRFGAFTAVDDVSFNVQAGEVFGWLGPNGAGKTTTIRMLLGLSSRRRVTRLYPVSIPQHKPNRFMRMWGICRNNLLCITISPPCKISAFMAAFMA